MESLFRLGLTEWRGWAGPRRGAVLAVRLKAAAQGARGAPGAPRSRSLARARQSRPEDRHAVTFLAFRETRLFPLVPAGTEERETRSAEWLISLVVGAIVREGTDDRLESAAPCVDLGVRCDHVEFPSVRVCQESECELQSEASSTSTIGDN